MIAKGVERASGVLQSFYFSGGLPGWKFITFPYKKLKSKKEQGKVILEIAWRDNSFQKLCFQGKTGGEWARAIFFFFFIQSGFGIRTCSHAGGNKAIEARAAGVVSVRSAGAGRERRPQASLPRPQISQ